jgi:hypothetical protein
MPPSTHESQPYSTVVIHEELNHNLTRKNANRFVLKNSHRPCRVGGAYTCCQKCSRMQTQIRLLRIKSYVTMMVMIGDRYDTRSITNNVRTKTS